MAINVSVIDASHGRPAVGVDTRLERRVDADWDSQGGGRTDVDGQWAEWSPNRAPARGVYRLLFDAGRYFAALGIVPFYPEVSIVFAVSDPDQNCHLTLLLGPHAYTAFRSTR